MGKKVNSFYNKIIGAFLLFIGWIILAYILSNSRLDIKLGIEFLFGFIVVDFFLFLVGISFFSSVSIKEIFKKL